MPGLLDFLQSASNAAAGNVSGPVDLLALGLRKLGVPVGDAPLGGSEWMRRSGLTRDVQQSPASLLGETAGLLAPIAAAAKAPQIAKGLLTMGENAAAPSTLNPQTGAIVWHGSPHKFDRFDSSKIGTGEGAQAYGHGLYFADRQSVAQGYRDKLSGLYSIHGNEYSKLPVGGPERSAIEGFDDLTRNGMNEADALAALRDRWNDTLSKAKSNLYEAQALRGKTVDMGEGWGSLRNFTYTDEVVNEQRAVVDRVRAGTEYINALKPGDIQRSTGSLYKVDLPDSAIARMLDWDKPLADQSAYVAHQLERAGMYGPLSKMSNGTLWHDISAHISDKRGSITKSLKRDQAAAADAMRGLGIPGIRYLDGGSRGAGQGTSNYVVFPGEESLLKILERNGIPMP